MRAKISSRKLIILPVVLLLSAWIAFDVFAPHVASLRHFDPVAVGQLDASMWRSYYERRRVRLFWQLAQATREQFHAPFWRSLLIAYRGAKAAFLFKEGENREDYAKALPLLEAYFRSLNALNDEPFDADKVAKNELEWWIVRREPNHGKGEWERLITEVAAEMYHVPPERLAGYARLRVEAMNFRDERRESVSEESWTEITRLLEASWTSLHQAITASR